MWVYIPSTRYRRSPAAADSTLLSVASFEAVARSATWRTKSLPSRNWLRVWTKAPFIRRLSGLISEPSTQEASLDVWFGQLAEESISSTAAFPVPTSAEPASERESTASGLACSSRSWLPSLSYDPATCSWRTSQLSLFEDSIPYSGRWPKAGLMLSGAVYEQPTLAHRMAEIGGGVSPGAVTNWPTPRMAANRSSRGALTKNGQWAAPGLEQVAELSMGVLPREFESPDELTPASRRIAEAMWPTAQAADGERQSEHQWQTLSVADTLGGHLSRGGSRSGELLLKGQAMAFRTGLPDQEIESDGPPSSSAGRTSRPQLNPLFAEWLMFGRTGIGQTCVCAPATEATVSAASETASCPTAPKPRFACSGMTPSGAGREVTV